MRASVTLLLVAACLQCVSASKILVVFIAPGKSHLIFGDSMVKHLAAAGHEITYVTPIPMKTPPKNVRIIDVSENLKYMENNEMTLDYILENKNTLDIKFIFQVMLDINNDTLHHPNVREMFMDTSQDFDLVIVEWMFGELPAAFAAIYGAPYIWAFTAETHWTSLRLIDEASNPAYSTDMLISSTPPSTFVQRVKQLLFQIGFRAVKKLWLNSYEEEIYSSLTPYFKARGRQPPLYEELAYNASMIFGNAHVSTGEALALPLSYKAIGGLHIDSNVPPLPEDFKKIMDSAKNGVIYFSLGSHLKSKDMPKELKTSLLKMFGDLKQTVIWKFEEVLPEQPKNLHIMKWAPQQSILAHPNCVLFITHGGQLSTTESIHFAKPIIGIPVFGDQFSNIGRAVAKGFAKKVDLSLTMTKELKAAIDDVLQDSKYRIKAKELSFIYHDRPVPPAKEMVHWVEHVIKTRGALHLRSPALNVPFYQKYYLDLLALIVAVSLVIRTAFRWIFKKSSRKQKTQ